MLQAQKVRLTDYLDERSADLTQFAEEANADARILANIEIEMQAFEESAELKRVEIEKNDNKVADIEGQMEKDRYEGMFFKNLGQKAPVDKAKAKEGSTED